MADFEILEDITSADVAVRFYGNSLENLFLAGGRAVVSVMIDDAASLGSGITRSFDLESEELDLLLYAFLQEFVFYKDAELLLLAPKEVSITSSEGRYRLRCLAAGERANTKKHSFNVDVKAVTMHKFEVKCENGRWSATVVFDV